MKFRLSTAGYFYKKEDAEKLSELGFTFTESKSKTILGKGVTAFEINGYPEIEFTTIEEFINFCNYWGQVIINDDNKIIIYDDYVE